MDRTHEGRAFRILTIMDGYTRECLAIVVGRRTNSHDVLYTPADLFLRPPAPMTMAFPVFGFASSGSSLENQEVVVH